MSSMFFLGKKCTHYMLLKLINLDVLFLNLDTDLHGMLKSQGATKWAKHLHVHD